MRRAGSACSFRSHRPAEGDDILAPRRQAGLGAEALKPSCPSLGSVTRIVREIVIRADPAVVFRHLTEPAERAKWAATMIEEPMAPGERMEKGAKIRAKRKVSTTGGRYVLTVTAFDPAKKLGMHVERNGQPTAETAFELERVPEGTRVRSATEYELKGLQKMMSGVVQSTMEKDMAAELASLKRHVESGA